VEKKSTTEKKGRKGDTAEREMRRGGISRLEELLIISRKRGETRKKKRFARRTKWGAVRTREAQHVEGKGKWEMAGG